MATIKRNATQMEYKVFHTKGSITVNAYSPFGAKLIAKEAYPDMEILNIQVVNKGITNPL